MTGRPNRRRMWFGAAEIMLGSCALVAVFELTAEWHIPVALVAGAAVARGLQRIWTGWIGS